VIKTMRARNVVATGVGLLLIAQLLTWWSLARDTLVEVVPQSARFALEAEPSHRLQRVVNGRLETIPLIVCDELTARLGLEVTKRFEAELQTLRIFVYPESSPPPSVTVDPPRCDGCQIVCGQTILNTPLIGRLETRFLSGNQGGNGYESTFVNILGRWYHWGTAWKWES